MSLHKIFWLRYLLLCVALCIALGFFTVYWVMPNPLDSFGPFEVGQITLFVFLASYLAITLGFQWINGGTFSRRKSAYVIVFLLTFVGMILCFIIAGLVLEGLRLSVGPEVLKLIFAPTFVFYLALTITLQLSLIALAFSLFALVFGIPTAKIANGERVMQAWKGNFAFKWGLVFPVMLTTFALGIVTIGVTFGLVVNLPNGATDVASAPTGTNEVLSVLRQHQEGELARTVVMTTCMFFYQLLSSGFLVYYCEKYRLRISDR